jgi:serine/threonine-protein kinase
VAFGPYQLLRRIGAGGMGEVFLAREAGPPPRAVVVKKVLPNLVANRTFVGRFLDEAKVVVRLHHPNIARVFAMGEVAGEYFLAMEYVQGKTVSRFSKRLRERKVDMPVGVALYLAEKVCEGLQHAHEATDEDQRPLHLVHRDLSPANVCLSYRGEVKIIDFGAAQSTLKEEQTAPRVVIGNLTYMAPEQARKQVIDGRADVYSCGVMLWELLAWKALPQKGDPLERWRKAASPAWDPPSLLHPSLPTELDELVLKALKRDPLERYGTAMEFALALRRARHRHAPSVTERDVGALLASAFAQEKQEEDEVLAEALHGAAGPDTQAREVTRRVRLLPPTALAYEHVALQPPAELPAERDATEPGPPRPDDDATPASAERTQPLASRTSFGVTYSELPKVRALLREIEGSHDEASGSEPSGKSSDRQVPGTLRLVALYSGIFVVAMGAGFLLVWLALR